jgi:hypothetical protein
MTLAQTAWQTTVATGVGVTLGKLVYDLIVAIARWRKEKH